MRHNLPRCRYCIAHASSVVTFNGPAKPDGTPSGKRVEVMLCELHAVRFTRRDGSAVSIPIMY